MEQGWHQLLRVLMYASTIIVTVFAGILIANDSANYTYSYSYSFDPNYELDEGAEQRCSYFESSNTLYCGELNRLNELMDRYEAVKGTTRGASDAAPWEKIQSRNDPASHKAETDQEKEVYERFNAWNAVRQAVIEDLDSGRIRFRQAKHWKAGPLVESIGITVGIATLWYAFTHMIYKVILFIAPGHTRIRRV